jgi:hypothetical protein
MPQSAGVCQERRDDFLDIPPSPLRRPQAGSLSLPVGSREKTREPHPASGSPRGSHSYASRATFLFPTRSSS